MHNYKLSIIGDLHFDDRKVGRHLNYWDNTLDVCQRITDYIRTAQPTHVILTGDVIGCKIKTLHSRASLVYILSVMNVWRDMLHGNLFSVAGNHDMEGGATDFDVLVAAGKLNRVPYLDLDSLRVHLIDYGDEYRNVDIRTPVGDELEVSNIAVMHNIFTVEGQTDWFRFKGRNFELSEMVNLKGIDMIVAGDLHPPSPRTVETSIGDTPISLMYVGSPTRPSWTRQMWDFAWIAEYEIEGYNISFNAKQLELRPYTEVFDLEASLEPESGEEEMYEPEQPEVDIEALRELFSEMSKYNVSSTLSYYDQIENIAGLDKPAGELAKYYITQSGYRNRL